MVHGEHKQIEAQSNSARDRNRRGQIEINGVDTKTKRWSVATKVCDTEIKMKVNTGAQIIPSQQSCGRSSRER